MQGSNPAGNSRLWTACLNSAKSGAGREESKYRPVMCSFKKYKVINQRFAVFLRKMKGSYRPREVNLVANLSVVVLR